MLDHSALYPSNNCSFLFYHHSLLNHLTPRFTVSTTIAFKLFFAIFLLSFGLYPIFGSCKLKLHIGGRTGRLTAVLQSCLYCTFIISTLLFFLLLLFSLEFVFERFLWGKISSALFKAQSLTRLNFMRFCTVFLHTAERTMMKERKVCFETFDNILLGNCSGFLLLLLSVWRGFNIINMILDPLM